MLKQFLADLARTPFAWGQRDCGLPLADWWLLNHGVDPAAHLRGVYASEADCEQILFREGCVPRLVAKLALSVGAARTKTPVPGDLGVVRVANQWFGAIMTPSGRWAIKCNDGLSVLHPRAVDRVVAAWSLAK